MYPTILSMNGHHDLCKNSVFSGSYATFVYFMFFLCSTYGPVEDVRIPSQQKRMFGFVTFVYPETVKLILSKGNPHYVCNSRVLVKPYREKSKLVDRYMCLSCLSSFN